MRTTTQISQTENGRKRARSFSFESESTSSRNSQFSRETLIINLHRKQARSQSPSTSENKSVDVPIFRRRSQNFSAHQRRYICRKYIRDHFDSSSRFPRSKYYSLSCDRSRFRNESTSVKSNPTCPNLSPYYSFQSDKVIQPKSAIDAKIYALCDYNKNENVHVDLPSTYQSSATQPSNAYKIPVEDASMRVPSNQSYSFEDLPLEWWERSPACKMAKVDHLDRLDNFCSSRERLVLLTTLWREDIAIEPNMFPYSTPPGIEHYTLWSIEDLTHEQIQFFVDKWLRRNHPQVRRWQYDDNSGERSFNIFHVHVFIEMVPYSFTPREGLEYKPPHVGMIENVNNNLPK